MKTASKNSLKVRGRVNNRITFTHRFPIKTFFLWVLFSIKKTTILYSLYLVSMTELATPPFSRQSLKSIDRKPCPELLCVYYILKREQLCSIDINLINRIIIQLRRTRILGWRWRAPCGWSPSSLLWSRTSAWRTSTCFCAPQYSPPPGRQPENHNNNNNNNNTVVILYNALG